MWEENSETALCIDVIVWKTVGLVKVIGIADVPTDRDLVACSTMSEYLKTSVLKVENARVYRVLGEGATFP